MPGLKRGPDGHVSLRPLADELGVDRRVLKRLHEGGELAGVRAGGVIWLEQRSLDEYLSTRPRCIRDGCDNLLIGPGPGCHLHRLHGRHHSEETKRKMSQTQRASRGTLVRVLQWRPCEREGCGNWTDQDRFCSQTCSRATVLNRDLERLREGRRKNWRDKVARLKKERGLLGVEDLVDRPKRPDQKFRAGLLRLAGVPRTAAAISDHIRNGWLEPVNWRPRAGRPQPDLGLRFDSPQLFTKDAVDKYVEWLRDHDHDGRPGRPLHYDNDPHWRGEWYHARHGNNAEFGRGAREVNKPGPKPKTSADEEELVRRLKASGKTQDQIADEVGVTRKQVRRILSQGG